MKHFGFVSILFLLSFATVYSENSATDILIQDMQRQINYFVSDPGIGDSIPFVSGFGLPVKRGDIYRNRLPGAEDPQGDFLQRKVLNGPQVNSMFGHAISSAGDVSGDGIDDFIIGAYEYNGSQGRVYIYFGGASFNTVADVILTGENAGDYFGHKVSSAGDVNGDGYSDVVIGAPWYSNFDGRVYVYFGGPDMNNTADVVITGYAGVQLGLPVSTAGDVNGDGYADVIAGAHYDNYWTGSAFIYFGGPSMDNVADVIFSGELPLDEFGTAVSSAGDINSDGYSDVIIGAHANYARTGRAYIYFGGASMDNNADVVMTGESSSDAFGITTSCAGDVNGDGFSDVIVGAHSYNSVTGRTYIYFGGTSMNNAADVIMTGEETNGYFGISANSAGDISGDGFSDVIVGAHGCSGERGKAYVYFGGASMNNVADMTFTGESLSEYLGFCVSSAGDVNADGYPDLLIAAPGYNNRTGRVLFFDYFPKGELFPELTATGTAANDYFGYSVSDAGDVNGDGFDDVIVGSMQAGTANSGKAYIYLGSSVPDFNPDVTVSGEFAYDQFGRFVSSAGDVNSDGYSDVIVGANGYSSGTGRAYLYLGGSTIDTLPDVIFTGEASGSNFGFSVSEAGDVNGDGYSDVIVGAYYWGASQGRAYLYFGGITMDNLADVYITGEGSGYYLGLSVSGAGDINNDGFSDVVVGAHGCNSNQGRATIYLGGTIMNSTPDLYLYGETTSSLFGYSVSRAGNVNGDAFDDVIVGSYYYGGGMGRAYIYYGGILPNNIADVVMEPSATGTYFGVPVSSAGDVNQDGYSDVIVGAHGYDSYRGNACVYFGGASMNNISDLYMSGEEAGNIYGMSVSGAGDFNGDNYSDLIVGAYGYQTQTGKSYIYFGSAISAKPILLYVKDVPNDQGGKVSLKWARSSYDVTGSNVVTDYLVQRSNPPSGGNFSWENIAFVPATKESFYSFTASTPFDSSSNNSGNFFFRITARTSYPDQFWRSAILSGRSIDNLAPPLVSLFNASAASGNVLLEWNRNAAPDLRRYVLYRSTDPEIDPETEPAFAATTDTAYTDTSPLSGLYYYFIVAEDVHLNKSPVAMTESPNITLNLTVFVEGLYDSETDLQMSDTLTVEMRYSTAPYALADASTSVLASNGLAVLKFTGAADGSYYIAVKHRNSIETWSASPLAFSRNSAISYNMSSAASQAYGNNLKQIDNAPLRFGIYSGDVNGDGIIDGTDAGTVDNDAANYVFGYVASDLNGDGFVDGTDFLIADNNAANVIVVIRP